MNLPLVEALIEDDRWLSLALEPLAERAARATLTHLGLDATDYLISLLGCGDARIATLNADFRGKPRPTNVLSWPSEERGAARDGGTPAPVTDPDGELGDIAIAWETCLREAADQRKSVEAHVTHFLVHGVLHLLGYDHERDLDSALMETLEVEILASLGLANPYDRDGT